MWKRTSHRSERVMSQSSTPEMVGPRVRMDKMTSVQQNREMSYENPKHDEASVSQREAWNLIIF